LKNKSINPFSVNKMTDSSEALLKSSSWSNLYSL
jgi:hypothetical protein